MTSIDISPGDEDSAPAWLLVMRAITGLTEESGDADNPKILAMAKFIARQFPEMESYCDLYQHDSTAWCGLTAAFCMAVSDIRPPFGPTDTDKFLWALSWKPWMYGGGKILGSPVLGCVVVMEREGGGHVTFYEGTDGNGNYRCRGGNQSDAVNVQSYDPDAVVALVWPREGGDVPEIPVEDRPLLEEGDSGPHVTDMQGMIPFFTGEIDGDFGPITKDNVLAYQFTRGLEVDGQCGEQTWDALYDDAPAVVEPPDLPPNPLTPQQQSNIKEIANSSRIASYDWEDRGEAPVGYTQGMALSFAQTYLKWKVDHPAAIEMAKARTGSSSDVFNVYRQEFDDLGMSNERAGSETLRHLYAFMLGSGMRESSGYYCCGRDQSADNTDANTCEAGTFQTSYNASNSSNPEFDMLMAEYGTGQSPGYLDAFSDDVSCDSDDWACYGSGPGLLFQRLCKITPAFAVETHGLTLRNLCNHYGPVNRHEVELRQDADTMFKEVQDYVDGLG